MSGMRTSTLALGWSNSCSPINFGTILSVNLYRAQFSTCKVRGGSAALPRADDKYIRAEHRKLGKKNIAGMRQLCAFYIGGTLGCTCSVLLLP